MSTCTQEVDGEVPSSAPLTDDGASEDVDARIAEIKADQEKVFRFFNGFLIGQVLCSEEPGHKTRCITAEIGSVEVMHVHITSIRPQQHRPHVFKLSYKDVRSGETGLVKLNLRQARVDCAKKFMGRRLCNVFTVHTVDERPIRLIVQATA